jgi:hypothetical protein
MKKIYLSLLTMITFACHLSIAQQITPGTVPTQRSLITSSPIQENPAPLGSNGFIADRCGYATQYNQMVAAGYDKNAFEAVVNNKIQEIRAARAQGRFANYVVPVVFHIIHDGTAEGVGANLSASQVYQQIDQLNKDFGNLSGSPFPQAADAGITFCPVTVDPSGNILAQPGINRINRITQGWNDPTSYNSSQVTTMMNYINNTIKPASIWDPTRFVNVWSYNFTNSGLLGYATFPTAGLPNLPAGETATTAGCVFLSGSLGSVASPGTAGNYALGRTVGHELGHFLGLYHVWGDVNTCGGTDECADTPPCSGQYFSTVPTCTIPTQCSGMPRMIQNYMDYSDDGCMNTFTQNQVDRMQAIMELAPRRPGTSALCIPPVANQLDFTTPSATISETGATGTGCPVYTDRIITVKPAVAANGSATVNFTFSGTATISSDFEVIGGTSLSFTNGESTPKSITVRIFDDGAAESTETIVITYDIVGTGLVPAPNKTITLSVTDNDMTVAINNINPAVTLYSENFGTAANAGNLPAGWVKGSFTGTGSNEWTVNADYGVSTGFTTGTNGRVLHITNGNAAQQSNETAVAQYTANSASDAVAITPSINTLGYKNIKLSFDYACNGEVAGSNVVDFGMLRYSITSQTTGLAAVTGGVADTLTYFFNLSAKNTVTVNLPAAVANKSSVWLGFEWVNNASNRNNPPFIIDNIVVTGDILGVETVQNQSALQFINNGQTVQYVSSTNKIIATVAGINQNVGCITANVATQGNNMIPITTNAGSYHRSEKTVTLTPTVANSSAGYQVTLYFTTAELAAWGSAVPGLKMMKVRDGVSLSGTLTNLDAQIVNATVNDLRATAGYVSYTGTFTGGFSQFMLVSASAALPVTLLNFEATPGKTNILLTWKTSMEVNNKGFVVERSTNGTDFEQIGWVDGRGNSSSASNYQFTDNFVQPNTLYYYRLQQTDNDNRRSMSETRQATIKDRLSVIVSIAPNPATDRITVFTSGSTGLSDINLFDSKGRTIKSWRKVNCSSVPQELVLGEIASGIYMLQVINEGTMNTEKIIIH